MTIKLFFEDSKLTSFTATIINSKTIDDGVAILLDQTAFYPTSGGQPFDMGNINEERVQDVWEDPEGIWHRLPSIPKSKLVNCEIDWSRRFDHMQQHTGQHIISAFFVNLFSANTISFHLGKEHSTIDLDIGEISDDQILELELCANTYIWENHTVSVQTINDDQIKAIPFRKPPQVSGTIRVIKVGKLDASACGGTHVNETGEIGMIKITGFEHYKNGTRISFICGKRALCDYQTKLNSIKKVSRELSIHPDQIYETLIGILNESKEQSRLFRKVQNEAFTYMADKIWNETPISYDRKIICKHFIDMSFDDLRNIAKILRNHPKTMCLLASTYEDTVRLICTRSEDLLEVNAGEILKKATNLLGGKGGGSPELAQGGAPLTNPGRIMDHLNETIIFFL